MTTNYQTGDQSNTDTNIKEQLKQDIGNKAEQLKQDMSNKARAATRQFAEKGKEKAEALSGKAADVLDDVEAAAEAQADQFEQRGWDHLSEYIREMSHGIGGLADDLRHKSVDELVRSTSDLARRNTGLFVLGAVAIGFGLTRFAKAAPGARDGQRRSANPAGDGSYAYPAGEGRTSFDGPLSDEYRPYESH